MRYSSSNPEQNQKTKSNKKIRRESITKRHGKAKGKERKQRKRKKHPCGEKTNGYLLLELCDIVLLAMIVERAITSVKPPSRIEEKEEEEDDVGEGEKNKPRQKKEHKVTRDTKFQFGPSRVCPRWGKIGRKIAPSGGESSPGKKILGSH